MVAVAEPMRQKTWREKLWPVEQYEQKKVVPMIAMMFLVCFVYTLLRDLKDILILTGDTHMPEASISILKLGGVLPTSVIVMLVYTRMTISMKKERIFIIWLTIFVAFFTLFGFVLYPMMDFLSGGRPMVDAFMANPDRQQWLDAIVSIIAFWPVSAFFVMSEMWGTVVLSLLFWGFANNICTTNEAKRFYSLFNIGANISLFLVGFIYIGMGTYEKAQFRANGNKPVKGSSNMRIYILMSIVAVCGACIIAIFQWMQANVLTDARLYNPNAIAPKKKKAKLSMMESLKMMFTSAYIAFIAAMVVFYGVSLNLVELYYKSSWKQHFTVKDGSVMQFQGSFSLCTGFVTLIMLVFFSGRSVRLLGWTRTALVTPFVVAITCLPFLVLMLTYTTWKSFSVVVCVVFGFSAVVLSKSCKYAFFDPTKEMAYIPLGDDRSRAKAAVDVTGARFGKSGGSAIITLLTMIYNTRNVGDILIPITCFVIVSVSVWLWGVLSLGSRYSVLDRKYQADIAEYANEKQVDGIELGVAKDQTTTAGDTAFGDVLKK